MQAPIYASLNVQDEDNAVLGFGSQSGKKKKKKIVGGSTKNQHKPKKMTTVKSGIGLSSLNASDGPPKVPGIQPTEGESTAAPASFITSRAARVLLAGAGFLADAYDLFVINLVLRLLRVCYPQYSSGPLIHALEGSVASSALFGSIIGQLVAGSLADVIGRKKIFVATAALITIGSLGSASAFDSSGLSIYSLIALWRFILGAGVGGEYPLAATVTSESSSAARRGSLMAAVFAMQGVGALISVLVVLFCLELGCSYAFTWRFALAFGSVPALLAFPWRLRMHETETFERVKQERKDARATVDDGTLSTHSSFTSEYGSTNSLNQQGGNSTPANSPSKDDVTSDLQKHATSRYKEVIHALVYYKWHILGTSLSWFLLDVDFYANGICKSFNSI